MVLPATVTPLVFTGALPGGVLPVAFGLILAFGFPAEPTASFFDLGLSVGFHEKPFKTWSFAISFSGFNAPSTPLM
ncbi:hypothetical protein D3C73_937540 [compost metagenome]